MEASITKSSRASHKPLATTLFSWAVCGRRPLTLDELSEALQPEFPIVRDLKDIISQMCGQFVVVDAKSSQLRSTKLQENSCCTLQIVASISNRSYLTKSSSQDASAS